MARYENTLSTLQARSILYFIENNAPAMRDKYAIEEFAFEVVEKMENEFSDIFPVDDSNGKENNPHYSYLAFAFSSCGNLSVSTGLASDRGAVCSDVHCRAHYDEEESGTLK